MPKHADNIIIKGSMGALLILWNLFFSACSSPSDREEVDRLNDISYSFHYRNIDSTRLYAEKALALSDGYSSGRAEAFNNLAYIYIVQMNYSEAKKLLDSIASFSDNQIELLVADVQYMRLCQRESRNKEFYDHKEHASKRIHRIDEEKKQLTKHQLKRLVYAKSEIEIVASTYYYYVGLDRLSAKAIDRIDTDWELQRDTAQYLNYLYQIGSGGILRGKDNTDIRQKELEHLVKCYMLAKQGGYIYWEANSMQAISEKLLMEDDRDRLLNDNAIAFDFINSDNMPDSLIAGYLAQKSLEQFIAFGDVYQTAGSFRTLASCYWALNDYKSSLICLDNALNYNKAIRQAPDLVASIREQLSLVYSAMDDKRNSDINRNIYLDLQEQTRQDRQLDARAEQLDKYSSVLNIMIGGIVILIFTVLVLITIFYYLNRRKKRVASLDELLKPLHEWKAESDRYIEQLNEEYEYINEEYNVSRASLSNNKKRNIENQAKIFLANSVMPLIDRMVNEVEKLCSPLSENQETRNERYEYVSELSSKIGEYNDVLTEWIQLRRGQVSLHVESFRVSDLFDILKKGSMSFRIKGVNLIVEDTSDVVKADRVLTLFMLNTLADNARKFTPSGGEVSIMSETCGNYVEISVKDTGTGLSEEQLNGIFSRKISDGHGFGLVNCRGIIEQYRKASSIFRVCEIGVESTEGKGSRFYFRLPKGVVHSIILLISLLFAMPCHTFASTDTRSRLLKHAEAYADSAYKANVQGRYHKTIDFADSAIYSLNKYYETAYPKGRHRMTLTGDIPSNAGELKWFHDKVDVDYGIILSLRDECAVAALALHNWQLYHYNNKVYTQLYKEVSTDRNLAEYCRIMQRAEMNKNIAIIILIVLLLTIILAYYLMYYRHVIYSRLCVDKVRRINGILSGNAGLDEKKKLMSQLDTDKYPPELRGIVGEIGQTLRAFIDESEQKKADIELAKDDLKRISFENDKIYVSNNILDNCLSTLKHETMYYPARIQVLTEERDANLSTMRELLLYYKELYAILSTQTMLQIRDVQKVCNSISLDKYTDTDLKIKGDRILFEYMLDILCRHAGRKKLDITASAKGSKYVELAVYMPSPDMTEEQCKALFMPSSDNIPFLICRQIVRNNSETTNLSGCGIVAEPVPGGGVVLRIVMARDNRTFK